MPAIYKSNEANNSYGIYSYSTIDNQDVNRPGYAIIRNDRKINGVKVWRGLHFHAEQPKFYARCKC